MATTNPANLPGTPVDPAQAQGAQIPLQSFRIPDFPNEARGLKALTLTCDIKVDEYQSLLSQNYTVPALPTGIESLTLELFSLGYPPGFLTELAKKLPNLKSVVVYSQLFAGITDESQKDAVEFFKRLPMLRALHFLDVFAKPGFFKDAAPWLKYNTSETPGEARRGLMFVEVNYTFRHEDEDFMGKIQATELPLLIGPGLISVSFNVSPPEKAEDDEQDPSTLQEAGSKEGVMAFNKTLSTDLEDALTGEETYPRGLRALNSTLYTMTLEQLAKTLKTQKNLLVLNATLEVGPGEATKKQLLKALESCKSVEQVEIVANPSLEFFMAVQNPRSGVLAQTFPTEADMQALTKDSCPKLSSFKVSILRTTTFGGVEWEKKEGKWVGGVKEGKGSVTGETS
ncbi:hypothetical protein KC343_g12293 [Hortaea werneckii]|nr:hypothetical protein KC323_g7637 [Hortaea werneckii]KAI7185420.1 hypothetical protein KC352_g22594 [Hortaea werneckii]KAI7347099.1 hypothetical protein KC320_g7464 [Hortaea werneckii]KAI7556154.1 hypothetical protein KC317_g12443 [Hortaea werneckii]KAI7602839.1 hypothetical protein KC346_g12178 [Hortaea werneckii]